MKPYGQVFLRLEKHFYIICTQCNEEITDYLEFQNHVLQLHLDPLSTEKISLENSSESKANLIELEIKSEVLDATDEERANKIEEIELSEKAVDKIDIKIEHIDVPGNCNLELPEKNCMKKNKFSKSTSNEKKPKDVAKFLPLVSEEDINDNVANNRKTQQTEKKKQIFKCSYCGKIIIKEQNYKKHILTHETSLTCKICGKSFSKSWSLKKHMKQHAGDKPFKCNQCTASFVIEKRLEAHITLKHPVKLGDMVMCTFENCGKLFTNTERKRYHELYSHFNESNYLCVDCGRQFKNATHLNQHYKTIHLKYEDRQHTCKFCNLKFAFKFKMIQHELIQHLGHKRFSCELCTNGYGRRWHLKRHYLSAHGKDIPLSTLKEIKEQKFLNKE